MNFSLEFEKNKEKIRSELMNDENMKWCNDKDSFNGRYYNPCWVVTSEARIYSLYFKRWLNPYLEKGGRKNQNGDYPKSRYVLRNSNRYAREKNGVSSALVIGVHQLVANYFCDKKEIKKYGEENCEVHHIKPYSSEESCTENNRASNLQYIEKGAYYELTRYSEDKADMDPLSRLIINTGKDEKKERGVEYKKVEDEYQYKINLKGTNGY